MSNEAVHFFRDLRVGEAFYLGTHKLKKTGATSAEGVNFSPEAVVTVIKRKSQQDQMGDGHDREGQLGD